MSLSLETPSAVIALPQESDQLISDNKTYSGGHKSSILTDLNGERVEEESYCDVILHVDDTDFKAHKCILGRLSLFFDKMFKAEMQEKYHSVANMEGINATTLQTILDFMYEGDITLTEENALDLLAASNYLQMTELKSFCVHYIRGALSINNCLYLRTQGQTYNCPRLFGNAEKYVTGNFQAVLQQEKFKRLSKTDLISIFKSMAQDMTVFKVKDTYEGALIWVKDDLQNRGKDFKDIFDVLRLDLLPTSYLNEVVATENLVKASSHCLGFLNDELQFRKIGASNDETVKKNKFVLIFKKTVKLFDLFTKSWKTLPELPTSVERCCVASFKNFLYVIADNNPGSEAGFGSFAFGIPTSKPASYGFGNLGLSNARVIAITGSSIQCLDLNNSNANWTVVGHTKYDKINSKAAVINDVITICSDRSDIAEMFRPNSKWSLNESKLNVVCDAPALAEYKGILYCFNGGNNTASRYVNNAWDSIENMKSNFRNGSAVGLNDEIFIIDTHNTINQSYHVTYNEWRQRGTSIKLDVYDALAFDDHIYVFGRIGKTYKVMKFDPKTDNWETCYEENFEFLCSTITAI